MTTAKRSPRPGEADPIERLRRRFAERRPVRTGSLIITVFGDVLLPRGGEVLLADLIALLAEFSLNDSQVRTAVSRLVADGWLEAERLGRRSLYRPTETGRHRFIEATRRIYAGPPKAWRGGWHVLLLPDGAERGELGKDLGWLGFGSLAPGVMLHPTPNAASLASVIADLPAEARPLVIAGKTAFAPPPRLLPALVERCWDLTGLGEAYRTFLAGFAELGEAVARGFVPAPLPALLARLMLIHDYRRLILRDPLLPPALLPRDWIGRDAYAAARALYRALAPPAERWINGHLGDRDGKLPAPGAAFRRRFP
ncbi:MAG TPA: phenylacetic acid degradation operon negative regulatory protein PaaX [Stellaceae bacterium]|nr:phenylacetic acid degradation operon negative regulatory protein PaaX [Stellaceae bacterium]